jgi:DNA-binding transcriptional ArsR family regulator
MIQKYTKLTNTVYKLLDFLPESDPLKHRAKDKALAVMDGLILVNKKNEECPGWASFGREKMKIQVLEDIDVLLGYFWIAKAQGWLSSANCLIVSNEYEKIKKEIIPISQTELLEKQELVTNNFVEKVSEKPALVLEDLNERQKQIIDFLSKNEKAQVMNFQEMFTDVTKRTIRRDLDELLEVGKIVRKGDFNGVFYKLRG